MLYVHHISIKLEIIFEMFKNWRQYSHYNECMGKLHETMDLPRPLWLRFAVWKGLSLSAIAVILMSLHRLLPFLLQLNADTQEIFLKIKWTIIYKLYKSCHKKFLFTVFVKLLSLNIHGQLVLDI